MGWLHEGHLSLIRRAREAAGRKGRVVVSLFVNPTQFGPREDLARYPRDPARDKRLCRAAGVDVLFAPREAEMYSQKPGEQFSTWVTEERLSLTMEGRSRPTHFRGVATIVAKLFNITLPTVALFGAKDWQQAAVVQRMVRDLNFPIRIVIVPTHREADGLATSSRNQYLAGDLRRQATVLWQSIQRARRTVRHAKRPPRRAALQRELKAFIQRQANARVDYIEFFEPVTLRPENVVSRGTHMALAVFMGKTRLIDNARL
jgi:pantoate--beta-alanine ligase